jgi:hypothetical protein
MTDLFDFDYTFEITEEVIQQGLKDLIIHFKACGNPNSLHINGTKYSSLLLDGTIAARPGLDTRIKMVLPELQKRGYCHVWNGSSNGHNMIHLNTDLRDWHKPEEIAANFRAAAEACIAAGGHYYMLYNIRTNFTLASHGPGIDEAISKEMELIAVELGLKHYKAKPESLGVRMGRIHKKNIPIIEAIFDALKPMKHWKEAKLFFDTHAFQEPHKYGDGLNNFITMMPNVFELQCLVETDDINDVKEIMAYVGGSWANPEKTDRILVRSKDDIYDQILSEPDPEEDEYSEDDIELPEDHYEEDEEYEEYEEIAV